MCRRWGVGAAWGGKAVGGDCGGQRERAEVFGHDGVGDHGDHEGVERGSEDGVLLAVEALKLGEGKK